MEPTTREPGDFSKEAARILLAAGAAILLILFALVLLPRAPGWNPDDRSTQPSAGSAQGLSAGWLDSSEAPAQKGYDIPPLDPATVMSPSPEMLERGTALFETNCASCHGPKGAGDGPAANTMNPKPRNFAAADGWKNGPTVTGIYKTLEAGIAGTSMAAYDNLPPKDRMALVHLVRSLGSFDHGQDPPAALQALETQFRASGGRVPNRIPVSLAAGKLEAESPAAKPLALPGEGDGSPGAILLRRSVADPERAAQALANLPGWRSDFALTARALAAGAPENGFSAGVGTLGAAEWKELHTALLGVAQ